MVLRLAAIAGLILVHAFLVAGEGALARAKRSRLELLARGGDGLARYALRHLLDRGRRSVVAIQVGLALVGLTLGWLLADVARSLPGPSGTAGFMIRATVALVVVYLHALLGVVLPRSMVLEEPERALRRLAVPLHAVVVLLMPLGIAVAIPLAFAQRRSPRAAPRPEPAPRHSGGVPRAVSADSSPEVAAEGGEDEESRVELSERTARAVMTPRTEIVAVGIGATLAEVLETVDRSRRSRFPVYAATIDNIVGVLLVKDLLAAMRRALPDASGATGATMPSSPDAGTISIQSVMRPAHFIPGTRPIAQVLGDFKRLKVRVAIVLDEYGGTAGLVTMDDLLEDVVGEILDEHDQPRTPVGSARSGEHLVPGDTAIAELNETYDVGIPESDFTTVGGFIFGALGRPPKVGDRVVTGGAELTVRAADGRRATEVAVRLADDAGR